LKTRGKERIALGGGGPTSKGKELPETFLNSARPQKKGRWELGERDLGSTSNEKHIILFTRDMRATGREQVGHPCRREGQKQ